MFGCSVQNARSALDRYGQTTQASLSFGSIVHRRNPAARSTENWFDFDSRRFHRAGVAGGYLSGGRLLRVYLPPEAPDLSAAVDGGLEPVRTALSQSGALLWIPAARSWNRSTLALCACRSVFFLGAQIYSQRKPWIVPCRSPWRPGFWAAANAFHLLTVAPVVVPSVCCPLPLPPFLAGEPPPRNSCGPTACDLFFRLGGPSADALFRLSQCTGSGTNSAFARSPRAFRFCGHAHGHGDL